MAKSKSPSVVFLSPRSCGIYKNGSPRFKTDATSGRRTDEIDNELIEAVEQFVGGRSSDCQTEVKLSDVYKSKVLAPTYYDDRYNSEIREVLSRLNVEPITLGELVEAETISVRGGHGSPGNDQRNGSIPYIKVSDIRGLRINVNPTNLVPEAVAKRFWRGDESGLQAWDVITPNRASSNIGEFAILLPGEERVVVTKEVFVYRIIDSAIWDPFYLHWALSLRAVREQWRRIALMQTNREDCGDRWREIILPSPPNKKWAEKQSIAFREYFTTIATAKETFTDRVRNSRFAFVANVLSENPTSDEGADE